jgi:hypothetical protein
MRTLESRPFSPAAQQFWNKIPDESKQEILANVFGVQCRDSVAIIDVSGVLEGRSLILRGSCAKCGHEVARVLEGHEQ